MDSNDTAILHQSGIRVEEGEWLMTDSATGSFVPLHGEGSNVVAGVSSEMAITYSVNARQRKSWYPKRHLRASLVTAIALDSLGRGWQDDDVVSLSK